MMGYLSHYVHSYGAFSLRKRRFCRLMDLRSQTSDTKTTGIESRNLLLLHNNESLPVASDGTLHPQEDTNRKFSREKKQQQKHNSSHTKLKQ